MVPSMLFLHAEAFSINPTYTSLFQSLGRQTNPEIEVLDVGSTDLSQIISKVGRASTLVIDHFLFAAKFMVPPHKGSVTFKKWRGINFYEDVVEALRTSDALKVLINSGYDLHWEGPENLFSEILPIIDAATWIFAGDLPRYRDIPKEWLDPWMESHKDSNLAKREIENANICLIDFPHCIDTSEFTRPGKLLWKVSIPGVPYATRILAHKSAEAAKLSRAPYELVDRSLDRIRRSTPKHIFIPSVLASYNQIRSLNYRFGPRHSGITWVDGSAYRYPVRKFFEVPAWGLPMVCLPHSKMVDYGFEPMMHFVPSDPENFGETAKEMLRTDSSRNDLVQMARLAQKQVARLHTTKARAAQLIWAIRRLTTNPDAKFNWVDGRFLATDPRTMSTVEFESDESSR